MIKVNLLGEEIAVGGPGYGILWAFAGVVTVAVLAGALLYRTVASEITELDIEKKTLESRLAQLEVITKEVKDLDKRKQELDQKLSVIARLRLSKQGPVRLFDDLNIAVTPNLWITEFKEVGGVLEIRGLALDDSGIVDFMKNIETSEYFRTVELGDSTQVYLVRVSDKENLARGAQLGAGLQAAQGRSPKKGQNDQPIAHKVQKYEQLTKEQRDAFDRGKFGAGVKLRSFTLKCSITYMGKTALKQAEEQAKKEAEEKKKAEAAERASKKAKGAGKDDKNASATKVAAE